MYLTILLIVLENINILENPIHQPRKDQYTQQSNS